MKYRGSTEIIDSILESIGNSGGTRTRIMYRAYLSYSQLKSYLALLENRSLVRFDENTNRFVLTEKGLKFRNAYGQISELVPNAVERNASSKDTTFPK
ncbi:MAG: winged helix-turn-helix domain-containing protein [Nitrososphaerales archaeon]